LRGRGNNISIDGLDNNDEFLGSSRTELSLETVQESQVVNSGLSAEAGGASGGSINVVTRAGANLTTGAGKRTRSLVPPIRASRSPRKRSSCEDSDEGEH
jgi:hypothetical protein